MLSTTDDLRIRELKELSTPEEVMREVPRTLTATRVVMAARNAIHAILNGQDDRLLVVVGPCSVHDPRAALAVLAGMLLLARPMQAVLTLTIVLGAYFLAEGVATIMYALEHRREPGGRWSWLLISGLVDIAISFMVITGLPSTAEWAIGVLVGINLLFGGATLIGMALAARNSNS